MPVPKKYTKIESDVQYYEYCEVYEKLVDNEEENPEIEFLWELISNYDSEHSTLKELDPIALLKSLMKNHKMNTVQLSELLGIDTQSVNDILHHKSKLSKENGLCLSKYFKLISGAFGRN